MDEQATAELIAETGIWMPRYRPALERWLDVAVVVEDSPTMSLWQPLMGEFRLMLERQGAFRDIRTWRLAVSEPDGPVRLRAEGAASACDPRVLASAGPAAPGTRGQ